MAHFSFLFFPFCLALVHISALHPLLPPLPLSHAHTHTRLYSTRGFLCERVDQVIRSFWWRRIEHGNYDSDVGPVFCPATAMAALCFVTVGLNCFFFGWGFVGGCSLSYTPFRMLKELLGTSANTNHRRYCRLGLTMQRSTSNLSTSPSYSAHYSRCA
jgi:hypothetical protein